MWSIIIQSIFSQILTIKTPQFICEGELWGVFCELKVWSVFQISNPDRKIHVANMGPTWVLSAPGGPHVGPMNLAIRECNLRHPLSNVMSSFTIHWWNLTILPWGKMISWMYYAITRGKWINSLFPSVATTWRHDDLDLRQHWLM